MGKTPKFPIGARVTVQDIDTLRRGQPNYNPPTTGWVIENEEVFLGEKPGKIHRGWWVHIKSDHPEFPDMAYYEDDLMEIPLKRFRKLLRNLPSIDCPWCLEHGRDLRRMEFHAHPKECQCWHHTHEEHMPDCPHGK